MPYSKKNWSSFVIYNNKKCKILTPKFVENANGLYLHQFKWIKSDNMIGALPSGWNTLIGEQSIKKNFKALHYTKGGPYFKKYRRCQGSKYWFMYRDKMLSGLE